MTEKYSYLAQEFFRESARLLDSLMKPGAIVNINSFASVVGDILNTSISHRIAIM
jgi:hypothetical protein